MPWNFISSVLICCFLISVHFQYGKEVNGILFLGLGVIILHISSSPSLQFLSSLPQAVPGFSYSYLPSLLLLSLTTTL